GERHELVAAEPRDHLAGRGRAGRQAVGGLGAVPVREEPPAVPAESAPAVVETPLSTVTPPSIPTTRPYPDSQAEELDVPDFLK
ncbi:hypothetical protein ACE14D_02860, partial [Streptomyces sp. Act-28]